MERDAQADNHPPDHIRLQELMQRPHSHIECRDLGGVPEEEKRSRRDDIVHEHVLAMCQDDEVLGH